MSYEFVASMLRDAAGTQGMRFFPMVFSLFMFVLSPTCSACSPISSPSPAIDHRHLRAGDARDRHRGVYGFMKHGLNFLGCSCPRVFPAC
jgi:F-type H+-transporting ATPase subunit a